MTQNWPYFKMNPINELIHLFPSRVSYLNLQKISNRIIHIFTIIKSQLRIEENFIKIIDLTKQ